MTRMQISAPQLLAVGAVIVILAAGAGFVGGSFAAPPPLPEPVVEVPAGTNRLLDRMDDLGRRVDRIGNEARAATDLSKLAIKRLDALEERLAAGTPVVAPTEVEAAPRELTAEEKAILEAWDDGQIRADLVKPWKARMKHQVLFVLKMYGDTTPQGEKDRIKQGRGAGQTFAVEYGLQDAAADEARATFMSHMERAAREVGPFLQEGLENADIAQVKSKLRDIWRDDDRRIRATLNAEQWEMYEGKAKGLREFWIEVIDGAGK